MNRFKRFLIQSSVKMHPDPAPAGGGGDGKPAADATPAAIAPTDARTYLADYGHDADALKALADDKVVELHGRVSGHLTKAQEAARKADFEKRARPEHIPEQFWDPDKREIRHDAMAKAYSDTRQALKEASTKAPGKPPESADKYEFTPPEGVKVSIDDKGLKIWREVAFKAGLSNEKFNELAQGFLAGIHADGALEAIKPIDTKEELAKLGPNGPLMVTALDAWGKKLQESGIWDERDFAEVVVMNSTADGVRALNKLREYYGGDRIPVGGDTVEATQNAKQWYEKRNAMTPDGKARRIDVDDAYRRQLDDEAKTIFGVSPTGSSMPGMGVK